MSEILWRPGAEQVAATNLNAFRLWLQAARGIALADFPALWRWSVDDIPAFWTALWDFAALIGERGSVALDNPTAMPGARFFPDSRLSYAENLLRHGGDRPAIVFRGEDGRRVAWSRDDLRAEAAGFAAGLRALGLGVGDRVAAYLPDIPEAIAAMLGTNAAGGTWSSCSPDFGPAGVLDRFGQIAPTVLVAADGYRYGGRTFRNAARIREVMAGLPTVRRLVIVPVLGDAEALAIPGAVTWESFRVPGAPLEFTRLPFNHPLYILYSSGTTGKPKCIVHGAGGVLLKHACEHLLHTDLKPDDRLFYFTTLGWMMWNWQVSGLMAGATLLLFDGNPFHPSPASLFDIAEAEGMTIFGTSAKYIDAIAKAGLKPRETHDLSALRTMLSTGSPLAPESFDYVYRDVKSEIGLYSISGGTDIVGCFALGNPTGPVRRGELSTRALGCAVEVFDDGGRPVRGRKGELVCLRPFPSMPVMFWNDPDGARYRAAYFERFPGVWHHGDWCELIEHEDGTVGMVITGRSDAVLNPGGVRIGTAEIYRQVETLPEIQEALVIGQDWDNDVRVVLFVRMRDGLTLDDALRARIRQTIRENASPRHVPAKIIQVADIPRTRSGKITELAVRDVVHGRPVKNLEALANPEALELFRDIPELRT
ncbi:acetoacetate--CoA ligase [Elioraea sp.]|uniref:acetoacetate--CoA ligase n=1 Tax=Elioraea sp. TaxID=2185103 RepID=UPI0021DEF0C5|nr:acetoacetate--CoA ligase [Elioraea sp.]GIX09871.1 MAG: acetoacetyl-CoA synthetase [Elioraea sp.]